MMFDPLNKFYSPILLASPSQVHHTSQEYQSCETNSLPLPKMKGPRVIMIMKTYTDVSRVTIKPATHNENKALARPFKW